MKYVTIVKNEFVYGDATGKSGILNNVKQLEKKGYNKKDINILPVKTSFTEKLAAIAGVAFGILLSTLYKKIVK